MYLFLDETYKVKHQIDNYTNILSIVATYVARELYGEWIGNTVD